MALEHIVPRREFIPDEGISLEEAWTRLGIGKTTMYKLVNTDAVEHYYVGRRHLVRAASVEKLMCTGCPDLPKQP